MIVRTLVVLAAGFALLVPATSSSLAATPATPYDFLRLESFDPQAGGRFADRMKSAGDLDRDGVGDVWIAAYSHDVGGLNAVGRIWAMSGRTRTVLYVIEHPEPQACTGFACGLGWNLSNLGDVDGDGINDLVAAANRQNVTAAGASCTPPAPGCNASQGKAYVFSGAPNKPRTPLYDLNNPDLPDAQGGAQVGGNFGWGSTAGDVVRADGTLGKDGISEVLVGAFQNDVPAGCGNAAPIVGPCRKDQGQAFIFNGAPNLAPGTQRLVRVLDVPQEDRYVDANGICESGTAGPTAQRCGAAGIVNEGVGDVNRDGYWDQSVTAWTTGVTQPGGQPCLQDAPGVVCNERQGRIYLYSGRDGSLLRKIDNPVPQPGALFGLQIVQAGAPGDVNGDGFDDVYGHGFQQLGPSRDGAPPVEGEGRAWVFSGQAVSAGAPGTPFSTPLLTLEDPTPTGSGTFGYALEKTDYDLDGLPDLYLGSFNGSYVMSGKTGAPLKVFDLPPADQAGQGAGNTNLGRSVAAPGDLNGDCDPDFMAGSPGHDIGAAVDQGRAYVYHSRGSCPRATPPTPASPGPGAQPSAPFADCPTSTANVIRGTAASERITGTAQADRIFAGTGNDTADGLARNDCIDLGPGTDRGQGGDGADLIVGGLGADRMSGNLGNDRLRGGSAGDRLVGGFGNDSLHGQSGSDRVNGERGRDRINGGSSGDVISAGSSGDRVAGDQGGDRINGNSGNDSLSGNSGNDRITGSTGSDRFSGGGGNDRINSRDGRRDRVNCGRGRDRVVADRSDRVARNCERVSRRR